MKLIWRDDGGRILRWWEGVCWHESSRYGRVDCHAFIGLNVIFAMGHLVWAWLKYPRPFIR